MRRSMWFLLLIFLLLFCGGCWDVDEIDNRAIVLGLGLDLTTDG